MSKSKRQISTLSGLVDSDMEEDHFVANMPTPDSAAENTAPARKGRGIPKVGATKVVKTKAPPRRLSGRLNAKAKPSKDKYEERTALADKTNQQHGSDTEEVEEFEDTMMDTEDVDESILETKKSRTKTMKKEPATKNSKQSKKSATSKTRVVELDAVQASKPIEIAKKERRSKREAIVEPLPEKIILETQIAEVEMDDSVEQSIEETIAHTSRNPARPISQSRQRQHSLPRRRAGSASDTERSDPVLRRKLGEITKKYDSLNVKYQDLREIGLKEAEKNFERLRKQTEEKTRISNNLIAELKSQVAQQSTLAKESKLMKTRFETQTAQVATLQAQVNKLKNSLSEAQAENKSLSTKLAANRTTATSVESVHSKVPGSAVKANGGIRMMGTAEAAQVAQAAQLKEHIYSDLTGLIIQGVKRDSEEDIFNCLQTGRNGTLHFKLAAANEKSSESYDDAQCSYVPQLDPSRDKELMELLPDYLVEEITFPRPQAAKFYARVVKALTERS